MPIVQSIVVLLYSKFSETNGFIKVEFLSPILFTVCLDQQVSSWLSFPTCTCIYPGSDCYVDIITVYAFRFGRTSHCTTRDTYTANTLRIALET